MPPPGKPELEGPDLKILEPSEGDTVWDTLKVRVEAEDPSGVRWVQVYLDRQSMGRDSAAPFEIVTPLPEIPDTLHRLRVEAIDRWENKSRVQITLFTRHHTPAAPSDTLKPQEKH